MIYTQIETGADSLLLNAGALNCERKHSSKSECVVSWFLLHKVKVFLFTNRHPVLILVCHLIFLCCFKPFNAVIIFVLLFFSILGSSIQGISWFYVCIRCSHCWSYFNAPTKLVWCIVQIIWTPVTLMHFLRFGMHHPSFGIHFPRFGMHYPSYPVVVTKLL